MDAGKERAVSIVPTVISFAISRTREGRLSTSPLRTSEVCTTTRHIQVLRYQLLHGEARGKVRRIFPRSPTRCMTARVDGSSAVIQFKMQESSAAAGRQGKQQAFGRTGSPVDHGCLMSKRLRRAKISQELSSRFTLLAHPIGSPDLIPSHHARRRRSQHSPKCQPRWKAREVIPELHQLILHCRKSGLDVNHL